VDDEERGIAASTNVEAATEPTRVSLRQGENLDPWFLGGEVTDSSLARLYLPITITRKGGAHSPVSVGLSVRLFGPASKVAVILDRDSLELGAVGSRTRWVGCILQKDDLAKVHREDLEGASWQVAITTCDGQMMKTPIVRMPVFNEITGFAVDDDGEVCKLADCVYRRVPSPLGGPSTLMVGAPRTMEHHLAMRNPGAVRDGSDDETRWVLRDGEPTWKMARCVWKVGRNDPCPCGSGRKYKKCHAV
jgi:hypothetical protein